MYVQHTLPFAVKYEMRALSHLLLLHNVLGHTASCGTVWWLKTVRLSSEKLCRPPAALSWNTAGRGASVQLAQGGYNQPFPTCALGARACNTKVLGAAVNLSQVLISCIPPSEWGQGIACLELGRVDVARKYITHTEQSTYVGLISTRFAHTGTVWTFCAGCGQTEKYLHPPRRLPALYFHRTAWLTHNRTTLLNYFRSWRGTKQSSSRCVVLPHGLSILLHHFHGIDAG